MNFLLKDYLPHSEERIARLRKIVNGRPVVILAAGPSIKELEERIGELRHADICYFGLNNFFVQETHILQQINRRMSVTISSCPSGMPEAIKAIIDFLNRDEDNMFISSFYNDAFGMLNGNNFNLKQFLCDYDRKLLFFSLSEIRVVPNISYPLHFILSNTLMALIQIALIGEASSIVLFGADGDCGKNTKDYYYRRDEYEPIKYPKVERNFIFDTRRFFNPLTPIAVRNTYKAYGLAPINILNCSENSLYTPFPKVSYDSAFEYLLKGEKFNLGLDLRVPKASVITLGADKKGLIQGRVENVLKQSYTNFEHILVCEEIDSKMEEALKQFDGVRLILEKEAGYGQAFKKAISIARGEYILYLRIGDGYLNQDWLNTCVEVLENNPEISLVWGLSQDMLEDGALGRIPDFRFFYDPPAQGKNYIYYWLKRKTIFSEGNLCVRKKVLEECFSFDDSETNNGRAGWFTFNYRFNTSGYLPYFVSAVANYSRPGNDTQGYRQRIILDDKIKVYKRELLIGKIIHHYKSGAGELLTGGFSRSIFIFFDIGRQVKFKMFNLAIRVKSKLPDPCCAVINKILFFWRAYKWNTFKVVFVKLGNKVFGKPKHNKLNYA